MSNRNLVFPDKPTTSVEDLQTDISILVNQLGDGATVILLEDRTLDSGVNTFRHGLPRAPRAVAVIPRDNVAWWMPTKPDGTYLYIQVAADLTGDLMVWL